MDLISLDAREILYHLNSMGYRNITADHLKEFMRDLKKLIKYETKYSNVQLDRNTNFQLAYPPIKENQQQQQIPQLGQQPEKELKQLSDHFEYLHITSTAASRAKLTQKRNSLKPATTTTITTTTNTINNLIIPHRSTIENTNRQLTKELQNKTHHKETIPKRQSNLNLENKENHQICTRDLLPKTVYSIRNTPMDLYQQYQKDWNRYKRFVPGENSRSDVRGEIRKKMQRFQTPKPKPKVYLTLNTNNDKIITRK